MDNYMLKEGIFDKALFRLGKKLLRIPLLSGVIFKINKIYLIIMPREEYSCLISSVKLFLTLTFGWIAILLFQYNIGADSLYNLAITICVLWFISFGVINKIFCDKQYKLLELFDNYLANVRHCFHVNGAIEDTIYESLENCNGLLRLHISQMYDILVSKNTDIVEKYKDIAPNKYFLTFMGLCNTVMIYGDSHREDKSVFLENIGYLRDEIRIEMLKQKRINHAFSGLSFMTIFPVFTLPFIEKWGISNLPELTRYYDGAFGMIASIIITLLSVSAFSMVIFLKNSYRYIKKEHDMLDNILANSKIYIFTEYIIETHSKACKKLKDLISKSGENISVHQFVLKKIIVFIFAFVSLLIIVIYGINLQRMQSNGIAQESEAVFRWFYPILCFAGACICSEMSVLIIQIKKMLMTLNYENEVMQFHSIIIMLIYIKRMSSEIILEWLDNFADVFKYSISECNAVFSMDSEKALKVLKSEESYLPFVRIVENLEDCDRVGPEMAFEEIVSQRQYFVEKRKQDNEINISNKGTIGKVIGYIPLIITVFMYLIFPFVAESINQLLSYVNEINNL